MHPLALHQLPWWSAANLAVFDLNACSAVTHERPSAVAPDVVHDELANMRGQRMGWW